LFDRIGRRFCTGVASFAEANDIPVLRFGKDDRKIAVMGPYLRRQTGGVCTAMSMAVTVVAALGRPSSPLR
jgi:hypothetical protein